MQFLWDPTPFLAKSPAEAEATFIREWVATQYAGGDAAVLAGLAEVLQRYFKMPWLVQPSPEGKWLGEGDLAQALGGPAVDRPSRPDCLPRRLPLPARAAGQAALLLGPAGCDRREPAALSARALFARVPLVHRRLPPQGAQPAHLVQRPARPPPARAARRPRHSRLALLRAGQAAAAG